MLSLSGEGDSQGASENDSGSGSQPVPCPVPRALLIRVLRLVAVRRPPALRRGLTEVVPDTPAQEPAPAPVTPAFPPAVATRAAQSVLQSLHGAHAPGAQPARPGRSRRASRGEEGGAEEWPARIGAGEQSRDQPSLRGGGPAGWEGLGSGEGPVRGKSGPAGAPIAPSPPPARSATGSIQEKLEVAGRGEGVARSQNGQGPRPITDEEERWEAGKGAGGWDSQDTRASPL